MSVDDTVEGNTKFTDKKKIKFTSSKLTTKTPETHNSRKEHSI